MIKIEFVHNTGSGASRNVEIEEGTTLSEFLEAQIANFQATSNTVRTNGQNLPMESTLRDGDVVVVSPQDIKGG